MGLKQRKRISNGTPRFTEGTDSNDMYQTTPYVDLNYKYNFNRNTVPNEGGDSYTNLTDILQSGYDTRIRNDMADTNYQVPDGWKPAEDQTTSNNKSGGLSGSQVGGMLQSAAGFGLAIADAYRGNVKTTEQMISDAGQNNGSVMGQRYSRYNPIDQHTLNKELQYDSTTKTLNSTISGISTGANIGGAAGGGWGAAIGAVVGGVAGLITGIGAGRSRRQKLRARIANANRRIISYNDFNRQSAMGDALEQDYYRRYGDSSQGLIYANRGKDLKRPKKY